MKIFFPIKIERERKEGKTFSETSLVHFVSLGRGGFIGRPMIYDVMECVAQKTPLETVSDDFVGRDGEQHSVVSEASSISSSG